MAASDRHDGLQTPFSSNLLPSTVSGSRRSSGSDNASLAAPKRKDDTNHNLDHIHSTASQSAELTIFNDFAQPPPSATFERGRSGEGTQTTLGGIYNRLRASVGASAIDGLSPPPRSNSGESAARPWSRSSKPPLLMNQVCASEDSDPASPTASMSGPKSKQTVQVSFEESFTTNAPVDYADTNFSLDSIIPGEEIPGKSQGSLLAPATAFFVSAQNNELRLPIATTSMQSPKSPTFPHLASQHKEENPVERVQEQDCKSEKSEVPDSIQGDSNGFLNVARTNADDYTSKSESEKETSRMRSAGYLLSITRPDRDMSYHGGYPRSSGLAVSELSDTYSAPVAPSLAASHNSTTSNSMTNLRKAQTSMSSGHSLLGQMRRKILNREFWMKDENAKVCFHCGDSFSTFRRKHHCRLCGQIYCSNCTQLVSGKPFGQASKLRVCKTCELMINGDDSSDYSDDGEVIPGHTVKQIRFSTPPTAAELIRQKSSNQAIIEHDGPSHRTSKEFKPRSVHGNALDRQNHLVRPPSSRSLKSLGGRPRSTSQKQRRSRNQHMRSLAPVPDDGAPFRQMQPHDPGSGGQLPVFHADSIIDPDLAPFMSDEDSSEDETLSLAATLATDAQDQPAGGFQHSLFSALRRSRPQSIARTGLEDPRSRRDTDNLSISSSPAEIKRRQIGTRATSVGSFGVHSATPRIARSDNLFASSDNLLAMGSRAGFDAQVPDYYGGQFMPFQSYAQRKENGPSTELNRAGLEYVRRILRQFLSDIGAQNSKQWEKALMPVLVRCAGYVDPNIQRGDDIDIRHYVKLKKAAGGSPTDTNYVSGVVFTKKLALKDMPRSIKNPRILLISFPLVYARHQQHFMSLEPIIAQEKEYLRNIVKRIKALVPSLLLVQKDVAGVALQYLQEANIAVAYNVKPSVLQAVSRCTQTRIVSSPEKLTMSLNSLGKCESFEVKTYIHGKSRKSFLSLSGCQRDLGCTIVLRGSDEKFLHKIKWITEFMCYVTYNLKLETSLMRDEFISSPSLDDLQNLHQNYDNIAVNMNHDSDTSLRSNQRPAEDHTAFNIDEGAVTNSEGPTPELQSNPVATSPSLRSDQELQNSSQYDDLVKGYRQRLLSVSPYVKLDEPYLVMRGRVQEQKMAKLRHLLDYEKAGNITENTMQQSFELVKPEVIYDAPARPSLQVREIMHAVHQSEYEKALHTYSSLKRRWETYIAGVNDPFSPLTHQKIVVLFSIVSTPSMDACEGPDLLGLDYYQEHEMDEGLEPDVPLGEYVERLCNQADSPCIAQRCEKRMLDHHRQYVHADGQVSVRIENCPPRIIGMENTILMWSVCRKCDHEPQVTPMSSNSWKYSFGKYLELSFWSMRLRPRAGTCPHDIHRDHTRYFGFKNFAVSVRFDSINVLEVTVPRGTVTWTPERDLRLKNEEYARIEERLTRFMSSVRARIKSINLDSIAQEKTEACRAEVDKLAKRAIEGQDALLRRLQEEYMTSTFYEVIPLNRAMRYIQETVAEWDTAFADFEQDFFPSENDIRRLATAQLRKVFLEREESTSSGEADEKLFTRQEDVENREPSHNEKRGRGQLEIYDNVNNTRGLSTDYANSDLGRSPLSELSKGSLSIAALQEHEKQLVQNLDLAVTVSAAETANLSLQSPVTQDHGIITPLIGSESPGQFTLALNKPTPLGPDVVAKVDQMLEASAQDSQLEDDELPPMSGGFRKRGESIMAPPLLRAQSQPIPTTKELVEIPQTLHVPVPQPYPSPIQLPSLMPFVAVPNVTLGKFGERSALTITRSAKSMIPRPGSALGNESKVSALAKHFEEMSREFEKERLRERRLRAQRNRQSRVYPMVSSRPIVELFRDADEAVRERDGSYEELKDSMDDVNETLSSYKEMESFQTGMELDQVTDVEDQQAEDGHDSISEVVMKGALDLPRHDAEERDPEGRASPLESVVPSTELEIQSMVVPKDSPDLGGSQILTPAEPGTESLSDLPKHEKSSLMKMLTRFWSERSASGWTPLDYPLGSTDHIFADSDIIIREDEPSSIIAFALTSQDYVAKLARSQEKVRAARDTYVSDDVKLGSTTELVVERTMLGKTSTHMKYQFQAGSARMLCKIFYAESFDAIRRKCGVADRFIESLSRSMKWDSRGGKSKSLFLKTMDERFILKSLSQIETQAFLKFAPDYFDYMSKSLFHGLPSAMAKMLGFYQVVIKNPATGTELNYFLQVMENVFYEGPTNRMFDLKGSMRNRRIEATGENGEVLLDENLLDYISQSPIYVRAHSNSLLTSSITNDTLFCSKQNVMDYSLIVGLYEYHKELMVGIIDYIRTYTWDKKLESWIKDRGKHKPTVMSPKDYRNRFRASIPRYFPLVPSCWHTFGAPRTSERVAKLPWISEGPGEELEREETERTMEQERERARRALEGIQENDQDQED